MPTRKMNPPATPEKNVDSEQLEVEDRVSLVIGVPDVGGERKRANRDHSHDQPIGRNAAPDRAKAGNQAQEADAQQDEALGEDQHGLLAQIPR